MLGTIVRKEILEHLKSTKFLIGLILTIVLMTISTSINIRDYIQRRQQFLDAIKLESQSDQLGRIENIFRQPQPLSFLVQGKDRTLGFKLALDESDIDIFPSSNSGEFDQAQRHFTSVFQNVDFAFVVKIALSLMVIFLAYNTIAGEKTQGTLKAVLANSVPKDTLLLGKLLGGMFVIFGSFLISVLLTLLLVAFNSSLALSGIDWIRIIGLFAISILYLCGFYSLTLFISVIVNRPTIALMILLQIWIFLVAIYPATGFRMVEAFHSAPKPEEIHRIKEASTRLLWEEARRISEKYVKDVENEDYSKMNEYTLKTRELSKKIYDKNREINKEMSRRMSGQMRLARAVAILSPAILYDMAVERLSKTGISEYEKFMTGVERFHDDYYEWYYRELLSADETPGKSPLFSASSESLASSFLGTIPSGIVLLIGTLIFFVLAYIRFLKKDIR